MSKVLCIYHGGGCADGLGAAWAVHRALRDEVEFVAAKYGVSLVSGCDDKAFITFDNVTALISGRDIMFVDFSLPLEQLKTIADEARSVLVLDHHKTAREDLAFLRRAREPWGNWLKYGPVYPDKFDPSFNAVLQTPDNLAAIFDLNRSGAGLTWDYFHPGLPRPHIIDLIEDRDLWKFKFGDETRAFHAVLTSYDITDLSVMLRLLDEWHGWTMPDSDDEDPYAFKALLHEGSAILRAQHQAVAATVAASRRTIKIAGHVVPCANVPSAMASDAGHILCQAQVKGYWAGDTYSETSWQPPFSVTYYDGADGKRHFSLRSPEGGADCGKIAKQMAYKLSESAAYYEDKSNAYTGGGHEHAAGFDAPLGWKGE